MSFMPLSDNVSLMKNASFVSVRLARQDEAACLPDIERSAAQSFRAFPALAWLADGACLPLATHLASVRAGTCWVAVTSEQERPLGFLTAERQAESLHILEMSVRAEAQGQGAGRALLTAACQAARQAGLHRVTLTTCRDVPWNAPFYRKMGFTILEQLPPGSGLQSLLDEEEASGFPPGTRCAMQRILV